MLVLGVVQDGGLPQAGCYSERCERARSEPPRYVASLALVFPRRSASIWWMPRQISFHRWISSRSLPSVSGANRRDPFDGIFLTHGHMGHYLGLALLGREGLAIKPTPCYCSPAMERLLTENAPWSLLVDEGRLDFPRIPMDRWTNVDGLFDVRMVPVPHRPEFSDTVGYMFRGPRQTILYVPDIDSWEEWDRPVGGRRGGGGCRPHRRELLFGRRGAGPQHRRHPPPPHPPQHGPPGGTWPGAGVGSSSST